MAQGFGREQKDDRAAILTALEQRFGIKTALPAEVEAGLEEDGAAAAVEGEEQVDAEEEEEDVDDDVPESAPADK